MDTGGDQSGHSINDQLSPVEQQKEQTINVCRKFKQLLIELSSHSKLSQQKIEETVIKAKILLSPAEFSDTNKWIRAVKRTLKDLNSIPDELCLISLAYTNHPVDAARFCRQEMLEKNSIYSKLSENNNSDDPFRQSLSKFSENLKQLNSQLEKDYSKDSLGSEKLCKIVRDIPEEQVEVEN
ncbi:unnamed protein product [Didymodactylos carnosus]|uniref:Uncharacterized protein n=1 Tax=Didymodactylos carnosus TaxID=1234261 RepID=A0A813Q619_9BILA|nr:unnamed protein product [Didymodactylos carnosus]CAF1197688.1 unnamed protein product [Didymodactylos carnosus]CAF3543735.1 unnamed protein product [Didymodactylos carnosus]CAF4007903.1 unnamed protein product [Didymodactylos carnosus]